MDFTLLFVPGYTNCMDSATAVSNFIISPHKPTKVECVDSFDCSYGDLYHRRAGIFSKI